jgi:hypothetical protein
MNSHDKIDNYLMKLSLTNQESPHGTWVIRDRERGLENLILMISEPLVILRIHVMEVPAAGREKLFEQLLRLNATDMVHGAYGVDGKNIVIVDTLETATLDLEEFEASIDAIGLALAQHYRTLSAYRVKA